VSVVLRALALVLGVLIGGTVLVLVAFTAAVLLDPVDGGPPVHTVPAQTSAPSAEPR
jgi:hypothetical protein